MLDLDSTEYFETSEGIRIAYNVNFDPRKLGAEETVMVLNYGLVCSKDHWKYQIPFFQKKGLNILLHDYRFHHESSGTDDLKDCTFSNMSSDLKELIDYLGIEKAFMVGHSMGVNVCLEFAKTFPEKVSSLVLISGTVFPPQEVMFDSKLVDRVLPYVQQFSRAFPHVFEKFWATQSSNPLAEKLVYKGGFNTQKTPQEFVALYMKNMSKLPPLLIFQLMEQMKIHDIVKHLGAIKIRSLVMGGTADRVIPNYLQKLLCRNLKNAELYIVKDGGHVPQTDFPDEINRRILHFYNEGQNQ